MKKTPMIFKDEIEREYKKWLESSDYPSEGWLIIPDNLLRRHHAKIRRMVAKLGHVTVSQFSHSLVCEGYRFACHDILEQLDAMAGKKGKP